MFKLGLIGCGMIGISHMEAVKTIDDAEITAVCDISEENLAGAIERTGAKGYKDYKEMVDNEEFDLVVINLPHGLHNQATCYCAEKGINVFLEKPMGLNSEDCKQMIDACKKNNVMLWVGHPQRYVPENARAKEIIKSGELGELVSVSETRNVEYFSDRRPRWFLKKEMSGGGIMINLGAHCLDKLKFFTESTIEEIYGKVHMREGYDVEDSAQAFVKTANGVTATFNLIGHAATNEYRNSLYLTKGEIRILPGAVEYCGIDGKFTREECDKVSCMTYEVQDVIRVLREGKGTPVVDGEYGMDVIHAIKRLYGEEK